MRWKPWFGWLVLSLTLAVGIYTVAGAALTVPVGAWVIDKPDQVLLEMGRAQVAEQEAARRKRRLAEQYKEIKK